jgi:hypothetical protein
MSIMRIPVKTTVNLLIASGIILLLATSFSSIIRPENKKIKVVCIDAGHGGKDPGCHGDFAKEKDVALSIARFPLRSSWAVISRRITRT